MTNKQFIRLESLLVGLTERFDQSLADNAWSIERMKRIDQVNRRRWQQHELDRVRHDQANKLTADRINELRERDKARDQAARDELVDRATRAGLMGAHQAHQLFDEIFTATSTPKTGPKPGETNP